MKKSLIQIILTILLCISSYSLFVLINTNNQLKEDIRKSNESLSDYKYALERSEEKFEQNIFSEDQIAKDIVLYGVNSESSKLSDIVKEKTLVYYFREETCLQCVEDELEILKKLEPVIGVNRILVISNHEKINSLKSLTQRKNISSKIFIRKDSLGLPIDIDDLYIATFFILDKELKLKFVYKAGGDQNINNAYFRRIKRFFQKEI